MSSLIIKQNHFIVVNKFNKFYKYNYHKNNYHKHKKRKLDIIYENIEYIEPQQPKYNNYNQINLFEKIKEIYIKIITFFHINLM